MIHSKAFNTQIGEDEREEARRSWDKLQRLQNNVEA